LGWAEPGASALFEPHDRIEPLPIRTCLADVAPRVIHKGVVDRGIPLCGLVWRAPSRDARRTTMPCRRGMDIEPARRNAQERAPFATARSFSERRRRMVPPPSPNRPEPTHNRRRPRTEGMGCEVEGRACSWGRAVLNTTPHGSPSRADPGLVRPRPGKTAPLQAGRFFARDAARWLRDRAGIEIRPERPHGPAPPLVRLSRFPVAHARHARSSGCRPSSK
jgi:hypothetical protein